MAERRKQETEVRRASIIRAARCVFARQGYAQTIVDDIAAQAGVAKGTLYLYFRSKEDVYSSILLEDTRRLNALTHERIDEVDSWDEKVAAYAQVRFEYLEKETDFVRIYLGEIRSSMIRGAKQDCAFYEAVRESEAILAQVFAAAAARGEIRPVDPRRAAAVAVDLIRGVMERQLLGWGTPKDGEFALDILCRSLAVR